MSVVVGLVYCILNTVSGKRYIGQTTRTLADRWKQHRLDAARRKYPLHCAIQKYGPEAFVVFELATATSQDELNRLEADLIAEHRSCDRRLGYNVRAGGDSGGKLSLETRKKISDKHRGRTAHNKGKRMSDAQRAILVERLKFNHPCRGRAMSEETKAKIGAANRERMLGRKQSEETKQKHRDAMFRRFATPESRALQSERLKGRPVSDETRKKISSAQKGKTFSPEYRQRIAATVSSLWTDPEFRANQVAKRVGKKASPEQRANHSAAMRRMWQARREAE